MEGKAPGRLDFLGMPPVLCAIVVVTSFLAALASGAQPIAAEPPPVSIENCHIGINPGAAVGFRFSLITQNLGNPKTPVQMGIRFTNTSRKEIAVVTFVTSVGGQDASERDVVDLSPGTTVGHWYSDRDYSKLGKRKSLVGPTQYPPVTCWVSSVNFADGSVWEPSDARKPLPG